MRYLCSVNPSASASHLDCCMVVLREMSRVKAFQNHPAETAIMRGKIDEILVQVMSHSTIQDLSQNKKEKSPAICRLYLETLSKCSN
eukprot:6035415-Amphidinium_carterae.1